MDDNKIGKNEYDAMTLIVEVTDQNGVTRKLS